MTVEELIDQLKKYAAYDKVQVSVDIHGHEYVGEVQEIVDIRDGFGTIHIYTEDMEHQ